MWTWDFEILSWVAKKISSYLSSIFSVRDIFLEGRKKEQQIKESLTVAGYWELISKDVFFFFIYSSSFFYVLEHRY